MQAKTTYLCPRRIELRRAAELLHRRIEVLVDGLNEYPSLSDARQAIADNLKRSVYASDFEAYLARNSLDRDMARQLVECAQNVLSSYGKGKQ